jgi:N-carbamoyl-L-amino-acid hydrolase
LSASTPLDRLMSDFHELSRIGANALGGVERQAATAADGAARRWLTAALVRAGATIHIDQVGNVFGFFEWVAGAPYVLTGSHLDSQPNGGRFDGAYGVLASLDAARHLSDDVTTGAWAPTWNLAVVDWTNEEGARFQPSVMGSSVFTGGLAREVALGAEDSQNVTVRQALTAIGFLGEAPTGRDFLAYAEIHVEQGSRLTAQQTELGIVTGSWAAFKYDLEFTGEQSHTGATPMAQRKDALLAAALVISGVHALAADAGDFHASVTELEAYPKSPNVVTARTRMHVELRAPDMQVLWELEARFLELLRTAHRETAVTNVIVRNWHREAAAYWPEGIELARRAASAVGLRTSEMATISGHDSIALNSVMPTVMLFTPSAGGWAHNVNELTEEADMLNGLIMITQVLRDLCTLSGGGVRFRA